MSTIKIKGLTKIYGDTLALDNVDLIIEPNKIYGLLGRNGAGKTTLLNLITNKIFPTKGEITIDGETVIENDNALNKVYYMMEKDLFPEWVKVKETFKLTKEIYPKFDMDYAYRLSEIFELNVNKKAKTLSKGYTSMFKAILALSSNANIIILDEPVLGLDANHRDLFYKELLSNYNNNPKTIIISTHLIGEIASVLEEAIIIKKGRIVVKSPVDELLTSAYTVSGEIDKVDRYLRGKKCIAEETLGSFKVGTIHEAIENRNEKLAKELGLDFGEVELQKLFISLTNS